MLKKRETPLQNITYIALISAVNVIFVLLTTLLPFLYFLIIFLLPLTSVIVFLFCKKRYFPIYMVATIGLCLIFNLWRVTDTIFYVAPSIVTGLLFGLGIEKKIPAFYVILASTVVQIGITYASIEIFRFLVEVNTIDYFLSILKLQEFEYKDFLPPVFIFVISSIQMLLTYIIIKDEIIKVGYEINSDDVPSWILLISELISLAMTFIFIFVYGPISLVFMGLAIYISIYQCAILYSDNKKVFLISGGASLIIEIFLYAILNAYIPKPYAILIILAFFLLMSLISFTNNYLENKRKNNKLK